MAILIFVFNALANERYVCGNSSSCNFKCSKWTELQLHIKTEHPPICVGCDKKFTTKDGLKKHLRNTGHDGGVESKNYLIKKFMAERKKNRIDGDQEEEEDLDEEDIDMSQILSMTSSVTRRNYHCSYEDCEKSFLSVMINFA